MINLLSYCTRIVRDLLLYHWHGNHNLFNSKVL
jgi:hypothetical protein